MANLVVADKIVEELGEGTFGKVVKCVDRDARRGDAQHVAIKIVKNIQRYRDAAEIEIDILKALQKGDPEGQQCVRECISQSEHADREVDCDAVGGLDAFCGLCRIYRVR
jgi:hypothetical protein